MKNTEKRFVAMRSIAIIALAAIIGFSMIACDNGSDDGKPQTATYTSYDANGNSYTLVVITLNGSTYVLTIKDSGNNIVGTSTGTVAQTSGGVLTLNNDGEEFTVTVNGGAITTITGNIPVDEGEPIPPPSSLTPSKPGNGGGSVLDGTWSRSNMSFTINGNNWVYSESGHEYSKGTWSSTVTPTASSTGTITLIVTNLNMGSGWTDLPEQYNSVKTNTATYAINAAGNQLIISNAAFKTDGVWGTLEGTYTKPGNGNGGSSQTWTAVTATTFTAYINAIAYGNNKFIAVGGHNEAGEIAYSADGVTWTKVTVSTFGTSPIHAIAYSNNKFVAVGGGKMAYSADGVTWTAVTDSKFSGSAIEAITYGNDKFVAGGYNGKMATSSDGVTWTAVTDSKFSGSAIYAIAYGNNKFVAVGPSGKMAYSSDGVTWTVVADSTFGTSTIYAIAYANNKFVAGGDDGKMAYSADGVTWTAETDTKFAGKDSRINGIAFGNGKFVAGGFDFISSRYSPKITYSSGK